MRALGLADVGQLADPGQLLGGVDRADVGVLVQRVADAQRADPPLQLGDAPRRARSPAPAAGSPAQQTWPWLKKMPLTMPSTAWSIGASSKTMFAALPPSSRVSFLRVPATARAIARPTSVEPVKATLSTSGCSTTARPVSPAPVTMLTTPGGRSACRQISANSSAVSGVVSAGLSTTVLPVASAGAIFHASISSGKFHGMTWPATPSGRGFGAEARVVELVGPAGVVEEVRRGQRDVDVAGLLDRLAVVERLQDGELAGALLQEPGDAEQVLAAVGRRASAPRRG